jgi:chromosome segregation ATPase
MLKIIFRILLFVVIICILSVLLFYLLLNFFQKSYENKIVNDNLRIHNQLENKVFEILQKVNLETNVSLEEDPNEINTKLDTIQSENQKITEIITKYENTKLNPGNSQKTKELASLLEENLEIESQTLRDYQEVNNYAVCVGRRTINLAKLQISINEIKKNQDVLENNPDYIKVFIKNLSPNIDLASAEIQKIPDCLSANLKKSDELEPLIKETDVFLQNLKSDLKNTSNQNLPLYTKKEILEKPIKNINLDKVKDSNQRIKDYLANL